MDVSFLVGSCSILSFLSFSILILVILTSIRGRMDLPVTWFVILSPWWWVSRLFVLRAFFRRYDYSTDNTIGANLDLDYSSMAFSSVLVVVVIRPCHW
jgi:hypothetical protein